MQIGFLTALLVAAFALSKVIQDEGIVELCTVVMPMLTYAIGCAGARKRHADLRLRLASEMRESSTQESALGVFEDMVQQGIAPDERAFNKALCVCARLGKIDRALQVREKMLLYGFFPSGEANVAMIRACTAAGRFGEALDIFEECAHPSHLAYHDAIHCYIEVERLGKAVMLYKDMTESDMLPCPQTFQRLSSAVQEQGWTETAAELLDAFASWAKRIDTVADDISDASTKFGEHMGDLDSE